MFWLSSKAYKIVKEVEPPVLIVAGKVGPLKRILICSGGKNYIDAAVGLTGCIAQGSGAHLTLLHVSPSRRRFTPGSLECRKRQIGFSIPNPSLE